MIYPDVKEQEVIVNGEVSLLIISEYDLVTARQKGKWFAEQIGFTGTASTIWAAIVSELARSVLTSPSRGRIVMQAIQSGKEKGMAVIATGTGLNGVDVVDVVKTLGSRLTSNTIATVLSRRSATAHGALKPNMSEEEIEHLEVHKKVLQIYHGYDAAHFYLTILSKKELTDRIEISTAVNGETIVKVVKWL